MSSKKRFENIEPPQPPKKSSLLGKFSFKRKLELPGVEREEEITLKVEKKPEPKPAPAPPRTISPETKTELKSLAEEIEIAEARAKNTATQQKAAAAVKREVVNREAALQTAQASADSAKSRLLVWLLVIVAAGFILWAVSRPNTGDGRHGSWANVLYFLVVILGGAFGGSRYRRNRW